MSSSTFSTFTSCSSRSRSSSPCCKLVRRASCHALLTRTGYLFTYVAPLVFVLLVTISKEAYDDIQRWKRDREANGQLYERLTLAGSERVPSAELHVGDLVVVHKDERIPADLVLLRTTEESGASFIRTDQLDGETDWKLRCAGWTCAQPLTRTGKP